MHFEPQRRLVKQFEKTDFKRIGTESLIKKKPNIEKLAGTTTIKPVNNVKELIKNATVTTTAAEVVKSEVITTEVHKEEKEEAKLTKSSSTTNNTQQTDNYLNYFDLITETLEEAGIENIDEIKNQVFVKITDAIINGDLNAKADISMLTQLININLQDTNSKDYMDISTITNLINYLLNDTDINSTATIEDIQKFIIDKANEIIGPRPDEEPIIEAPKVNLEAFFKGGETLTAYQIYNDKYSYMFSDDTVSQEIMNSINDVARKLGIQVQPKEYQNLLNCIIAKINDICGVENTNPPVLAKATLNEYFKTYSIDDLKALISSPEIENAYYQEALKALGLDDVFGDVYQNRKQGDCYFLSTLYSIANTQNGAALLADAFGTVEIDGVTHYTFTFKGGYRYQNGDESANNYCTKTTTYTFSPQQILDALKSGKYSTGDINYLVAELAFEALMKDQVYGNNEPNTAFDNGYLANGTGVQVMFLLTGANNTHYTSSGQEFKNFVMSLLRNGSIEEGTTGNYMMYFGFNGHAHAIVGVSEEGITYIDPYNSSEKLFMSWETILNNPSIYKNFQWAYIPSPDDSQTQNYSDWYNW